jgi:hypothetical protein
MNNKTLLLIFISFVLAYLAFSRFMNSRPAPPFDTTLIRVDTARITSIDISPEKGPAYTLHHTDGQWIVSNGLLSLPAQTDRLLIILNQLDTIQTLELMSNQPADWDRYGLGNGAGTRITIFTEDGQKEDFIIGKTDFDPELQKSIAYLRLAGQNEVFAVNGFLPFQLERHFNDFRNRELLDRSRPQLFPEQLQYQSLDTLLQFRFGEKNQSASPFIDSAALVAYFDRIDQAKSSLFADDFDELSAGRYFHQQIKLYFEDKKDSVWLSCYRDSTRIKPFIIHSSDNPRSYFYSDSVGLYKMIFEDFQRLIGEEF